MEWMHYANRALREVLKAQGAHSRRAMLFGTPIHFYHLKGAGSGPPLMLVHGMGSSANGYFRTLRPFARHFGQVFAVDLPGSGFSPLPNSGPMGLRALAELLVEFRRHVIGGQVLLLGNSLGGGLALQAASLDPSGLCGLALVSPAGARLSEERLAGLIRSFEVHNSKEARDLANRLFHRAPLSVLVFADELRKMVSTPAVRHILARASGDDALSPEALGRLSMPTLLLWGRSEKLLPYESIEYFRSHLPASAEVHEVSGFGHMPQLEHAQELVRRVANFAAARGLG